MTPPAASARGADERGGTFVEQARRRQIVEAAIEVLADVGYAKATFARIAERAAISPALISYHFAGKAELMGQVVADVSAAMDEAITIEVTGVPSYATVLRRLIETQVRYFADHPREVLALGEIFRSGDPRLSRDLETQREATIVEIETLFAEAQEHGELRPGPTRPLAITLLAALEAVPSELIAHPDLDADTYATALADLFDQGLSVRRRR